MTRKLNNNNSNNEKYSLGPSEILISAPSVYARVSGETAPKEGHTGSDIAYWIYMSSGVSWFTQWPGSMLVVVLGKLDEGYEYL